MSLRVQFTCPVCAESIVVPLHHQTMGIGLYLAHLIGEHWEAVQVMHSQVGAVVPGAWKRLAADLD